MANALVIHLFDSLVGGCWVLVLDESIASLVGEVLHGAKLFELVAELIRLNVVAQAADINLRRRSHVI